MPRIAHGVTIDKIAAATGASRGFLYDAIAGRFVDGISLKDGTREFRFSNKGLLALTALAVARVSLRVQSAELGKWCHQLNCVDWTVGGYVVCTGPGSFGTVGVRGDFAPLGSEATLRVLNLYAVRRLVKRLKEAG